MSAITRAVSANTTFTGQLLVAEASEAIGAADAIKLVGNKAEKASSTPSSGANDVVAGIAVSPALGAGQSVLYVETGTIKRIASGMTKGEPVYLGAPNGGWEDATVSRKSITLLGWWINGTDLLVDIINTNIVK